MVCSKLCCQQVLRLKLFPQKIVVDRVHQLPAARHHQPSEDEQIVFRNRVDLYHTSLDSDESRNRKRRFEVGHQLETRGACCVVVVDRLHQLHPTIH